MHSNHSTSINVLTSSNQASRTSSRDSYRPDIQGLRALAVLFVVAFHADFPFAKGGFVGVDVFFVISGYLITGLLLREIERTGKLNLAGFWARRARRLLPASILVLSTTLFLSLLVLPLLQRQDVIKDVLWSAVFMGNWRFAAVQTDYWSTRQGESPILHYWSLGVEEQFYFVWPVILGLTGLLIRLAFRVRSATSNQQIHTGHASLDSGSTNFRIALASVCTLTILISFWRNVELTRSNQPFAYFGTGARVWQLAIGGLISICWPVLEHLPVRLKSMLFRVGLLLLVVGTFFLGEHSASSTGYPGVWALIPTLATVAIIIGGKVENPTLWHKGLSSPLATHIGAISYSLYLVHWPLLVLGRSFWRNSELLINFVLVVAAFPIAALLKKFIEDPIRYSQKPKLSNRLALQLSGSMIALVALFGGLGLVQTKSAYAATAVVKDGKSNSIKLHPSPALASQDYFSLAKFGCALGVTETRPRTCQFGDRKSKKKVLLLGDSHASAIFPAVQAAALQNHWKLYVWEKNSCPIAKVTKWDPIRRRPFWECNQFRDWALKSAISLRPNLVIVTNAYNPKSSFLKGTKGQLVSGSQNRNLLKFGFRKSMNQIIKHKIPVIYLHEPPVAPFSPPNCLVTKRDVQACEFKAPLLAPEFESAKGMAGVSVLDLYSAVCLSKICNPVKGDILVYRDVTHMTQTYVLTLVRKFADLLGDNGSLIRLGEQN